ncbi:Uncharacterized protein GBIM_16061, partial [Gryllus bimaculatus]
RSNAALRHWRLLERAVDGAEFASASRRRTQPKNNRVKECRVAAAAGGRAGEAGGAMVVTGPVGPNPWAMPVALALHEKGEKEDAGVGADDAGWARRWPLHAAAQDGHANGASLSPLEVAAKEGHYDVTLAMLDRGASANYRLVEAALLVASTGPVVRALWRSLPFGASRVTSTEALRRMARDGHEDALRTLIAMGAPSSAHEGGLLATLLALQDDLRQAHCVRALLECRASANARDGDGQTALHKAVGLSHADCVSALIKHGARL